MAWYFALPLSIRVISHGAAGFAMPEWLWQFTSPPRFMIHVIVWPPGCGQLRREWLAEVICSLLVQRWLMRLKMHCVYVSPDLVNEPSERPGGSILRAPAGFQRSLWNVLFLMKIVIWLSAITVLDELASLLTTRGSIERWSEELQATISSLDLHTSFKEQAVDH